MEIKIIKSSKDSYWYADQIGLRFDVSGVQEDIYEVVKWIEYPRKYDIAPVLKEDCKEIYVKSHPAVAIKNTDWRVKTNVIERGSISIERSGFKMIKEIEHYEKLNKEAAVKSAVKNDKEEAPE